MSKQQRNSIDLSVVIPLLNEVESLPELNQWLHRVMQQEKLDYEILYIDDGSTDGSWSLIKAYMEQSDRVKGIRFIKNYGKSQALHAGFARTIGDVVITMDADLQDSPEEIPSLYQLIKDNDYDLVSGWKKKRHDNLWTKNLPSKVFNWAARKASNLDLHDFNCGLKAYKKEVIKCIEVTGEMHRYIPVLAANAGFTKITEKPVIHQARKYGQTKFGPERFVNGFLDLITISFLSKYGKRPMHFFGLWGAFMFAIGFVSAAALGGVKLYHVYQQLPYPLVTQNPWFDIALTTMILGCLFFVAGFLGELTLRQGPSKNRYYIAEES